MPDFIETLKWGWKNRRMAFFGFVSIGVFILIMIGATVGVITNQSVNKNKGHIEYITLNDTRRVPCLYNDGLTEFISCDWDHADGADKVE